MLPPKIPISKPISAQEALRTVEELHRAWMQWACETRAAGVCYCSDCGECWFAGSEDSLELEEVEHFLRTNCKGRAEWHREPRPELRYKARKAPPDVAP